MPKKKMPAEVREYFRKQGSKGGKLGAQKRIEELTPEQRAAIAKKAAAARWGTKDSSTSRASPARTKATAKKGATE